MGGSLELEWCFFFEKCSCVLFLISFAVWISYSTEKRNPEKGSRHNTLLSKKRPLAFPTTPFLQNALEDLSVSIHISSSLNRVRIVIYLPPPPLYPNPYA